MKKPPNICGYLNKNYVSERKACQSSEIVAVQLLFVANNFLHATNRAIVLAYPK